jgi:transposase
LEMIDTECNRLEHESSAVRSEIASHIDYLRKRLKRMERDIDGAVRSSELWRHQAQLMDSVPGVGPIVRASALAWLPELGQLNRADVAKLVEIAPLADDSGKTRGYRRVAGGRGAAAQNAVHGHHGSDAA